MSKTRRKRWKLHNMNAEAYTLKNAGGYWVGCIVYPSGVRAKVTNAQHEEHKAFAIAERMADHWNKALKEEMA